MLEVFLVSLIPVVELRGAIPLGILSLELPWLPVLVLGILGSFLPAILIVWGLERLLLVLDRHTLGSRLSGLTRWFVGKKSKPVEKWGSLGLVLLVAVPLPFTGVWTGSLVASVLRLSIGRALVCILLGCIIAGGIVTYISVMV